MGKERGEGENGNGGEKRVEKWTGKGKKRDGGKGKDRREKS